jgi:hypothetical protein
MFTNISLSNNNIWSKKMELVKSLILIVLLILVLNESTPAQKKDIRYREKSVREEVNQFLLNNYTGTYKVAEVIDIDALKGSLIYFYETIQNPYGLLTNTFVFITYIAKSDSAIDTNLLGVYKEGQIKILSEGELPGYERGSFFAIDDITNDGKVEIITKWLDHPLQMLYIHSWDGISGNARLISEPVLDGNQDHWIEAYYETFDLFDADGDGIQEIRSLESDDGSQTWSWNGEKYGKWTNTPQVSVFELLSANNFIPYVYCEVSEDEENFRYKYIVENDELSRQRINRFWVVADVPKENLQKEIPANWKGSGYAYNLDGWSTRVLNDGNLIWPGDKLSGFNFITSGLPAVAMFRMQAKNDLPWTREMNTSESLALSLRNRNENMVFGKTIGPKALANPFVPLDFLDSLIHYIDQSDTLGWIKNQSTFDKYNDYLVTAKNALEQNQIDLAKATLESIVQEVDIDSTSNLTSEAYALIKFNTEYLLANLPEESDPALVVSLINSSGDLLENGKLKYYEGGWKDAVDIGDGTFRVVTDKSTVSLRMTYAFGSQTVSNIEAQSNIYSFQTVNTEVRLIDSEGNLITDDATVKYYSGGWREFGTTTNGVANKELLPNSYSFRMNYAFANKDKKQDLNTDPIVVFQTVNTSVRLNDSQGNPITEEAIVKYYSGGWRNFGTIENGVASKELLPNNYSFRMNYAFANKDKKQDLNTDPVVVFQTVNTSVRLLNDSQGNPITEEATVKYYSGGWREFGTTVNGIANKELLPNNYSFRMNYAFAKKDKKQDLNADPIVVFHTVNASVQLNDSQGNPIADEATVKYYSGGWRDFGATVSGVANKELLANNYSFRMNYAFANKDKKQDISADPVVVFQTVNASVQLNDSQRNPITEEATVKYYSGGWREFGAAINGVANKELLPNNYSFRMTHKFISNDKKQDLVSNNEVEFSTIPCVIRALRSDNQLISGALIKYYSGGWRDVGTTSNGEVAIELLPANLSFRGIYDGISKDVKQDTGTNNIVEIIFE